MEDFLKDYVEMMADARDMNLSDEQLQEVVNSLQDNEELWDIFDGYVGDELDAVEDDD